MLFFLTPFVEGTPEIRTGWLTTLRGADLWARFSISQL
jgi:hypothetical protein